MVDNIQKNEDFLFRAEPATILDILGNGKKYEVPYYQRDYSWKENHWDDIWEDLIDLLNGKTDIHYMGTIALSSLGNNNFSIIDGQQRIITISLLILASIKKLKDFNTEESNKRADMLMNKYLTNENVKSIAYESKLTLNENNKNFYKSNLLHLELDISKSGLNDSNKWMFSAFNYFYDKFKNEDLFQNDEKIVDFIESIVTIKLKFLTIKTGDDFASQVIFESLNATGLPLTKVDLIKNYLFLILKEDEYLISILKDKWQTIAEKVSIIKMPEFLRYYLNSKQNIVREDRLFKEIKNTIKLKNEVKNLIFELEKYADVFVALSDYEDGLWNDEDNIRKEIKEISLFKKSKQHKPLLLSAYFKFLKNGQKDIFEKLLKLVKVIMFRYTVICDKNPNDLEKIYNKTAVGIHNNELQTIDDIKNSLAPIYINDDEFRKIFEEKSFSLNRDTKIVRYILTKIENQMFNHSYGIYDTQSTIEHIYPQNFDDENFDLDIVDMKKLTDRIGNLTLLEPNLNKEASNKKFLDKKRTYEKSEYDMTKDLLNYEEWEQDSIKERQTKFAKIATSIWRIS